MKPKHIEKIEQAAQVLDLQDSPDVQKLIKYLRTWDNDCPYTFAHTRHWCGYKGCRES